MGSLAKFWGGADDKYHYHLTPLGIHYTQQKLVPKLFFSIIPIVAWVGVAICIVAALVVGPLAFVGAGAMALMSFVFVNYKPKEPDELITYFIGVYTLFDLKDRDRIELESDRYEHWNSNRIHCDIKDKQTLIEHLKAQIPNLHVVEVADYQEYKQVRSNYL